jgi:hypothetical protein
MGVESEDIGGDGSTSTIVSFCGILFVPLVSNSDRQLRHAHKVVRGSTKENVAVRIENCAREPLKYVVPAVLLTVQSVFGADLAFTVQAPSCKLTVVAEGHNYNVFKNVSGLTCIK